MGLYTLLCSSLLSCGTQKYLPSDNTTYNGPVPITFYQSLTKEMPPSLILLLYFLSWGSLLSGDSRFCKVDKSLASIEFIFFKVLLLSYLKFAAATYFLPKIPFPQISASQAAFFLYFLETHHKATMNPHRVGVFLSAYGPSSKHSLPCLPRDCLAILQVACYLLLCVV